jgi:hypothetical protein
MMSNIFGDFSGVDSPTNPSYFFGEDHINDRFIVRRWVAGDFAYADGVNLLQVNNDGSAQYIGPFGLVSYTVAGVPSAASYPASLIYVSNEAGGAVPAFSDGTDWRRVTDRAIIS